MILMQLVVLRHCHDFRHREKSALACLTVVKPSGRFARARIIFLAFDVSHDARWPDGLATGNSYRALGQENPLRAAFKALFPVALRIYRGGSVESFCVSTCAAQICFTLLLHRTPATYRNRHLSAVFQVLTQIVCRSRRLRLPTSLDRLLQPEKSSTHFRRSLIL